MLASIEHARITNNSERLAVIKYTSPKHLFELFLKEAGHLSSKQLGSFLGEECSAILVCHSRMLSALLLFIGHNS